MTLSQLKSRVHQYLDTIWMDYNTPKLNIYLEADASVVGEMDSNYNMYDYDLLYNILEYYIYLCNIYNKEVSSMGYSKLMGISNEIISMWGNDSNKLSSRGFEIYKKLNQEREESLSNILISGKRNPVGILGALNRHYQWNMPGVSNKGETKAVLSAAELPQLNKQKAVELPPVNDTKA